MSPAIVRNQYDGETGFGCSWRTVRTEGLRVARIVSQSFIEETDYHRFFYIKRMQIIFLNVYIKCLLILIFYISAFE